MSAKRFATKRPIRIHGAAGPNKPSYWVHGMMGEVNKPCGDLFGEVFDQYNYVYIFSTKAIPYSDGGVPEWKLERDQCLDAVMRRLEMNLHEGVIEIWADNK